MGGLRFCIRSGHPALALLAPPDVLRRDRGRVRWLVVDAVWYAFLSSSTGLYEIIPGFLCGLLAAVIVSLCSKAPSKEVTDLFDRAFEPTD